MYSKNDYRYYLEDQLIHSDDFLAHYGVKGMKWKQHLKRAAIPSDLTFEKRKSKEYDGTVNKGYRLDFEKHRNKQGGVDWSEGVGIETSRNKKTGAKGLSFYNTKRVKFDKNGDYVTSSKNIGRINKERAEDGVHYNIDLSPRKVYKKNRKRRLMRDVNGAGFNVEWTARDAVRSSKKK